MKRIFKQTFLATLVLGLSFEASALVVNTGAHTFTGNVNGAGASARHAFDSSADVGLGVGGAGLQYNYWLNGWEAGDTFSVRGDDVAQFDPMRPANGDASFYGTGQQAMCQGGVCAEDAGVSFGWNHTSQHLLFTLTGANQDLTITLSGASSLAPAVTGKHGPNVNSGNLGTNQPMSWALFSGKGVTGVNDSNHTFEHGPGSVHWSSNLVWMDSDLNGAGDLTITRTLSNLAAGDYTLYIGGNISNPPAPGGGAKNFYFAASSVASVPVPAAAWLFGGGLMSLGAFGRRKKTA